MPPCTPTSTMQEPELDLPALGLSATPPQTRTVLSTFLRRHAACLYGPNVDRIATVQSQTVTNIGNARAPFTS